MATTTQLSVLLLLNKAYIHKLRLINYVKGLLSSDRRPFFAVMLQTEIVNRVGVITLDRPEKRNAFNAELVQLINNAVVAFNANESVRAILLNANGEAFSAGADLSYLKQLRTNTLQENKTDSLTLAKMFSNIYNSPKLTFSAVNGFALAGGCGLATVTDFCWATPESKFGYTEVKIGFIPAIVLTFLAKKITGTNLNKLLLTGSIVKATDALQMGLISEIVSTDNFNETVLVNIQKIISPTSPNSIAKTKELMRKTANLEIEEALELASIYNAESRASDDCVAGVDAFLNKEKMTW